MTMQNQVHRNEMHMPDSGGDQWLEPGKNRPFPYCSYCGSMHPLELLRLFGEGLIDHLHLADMKYGFPHKFYVELVDKRHAKFYIQHMQDLADHDTEAFARLAKRIHDNVDIYHPSIDFALNSEGKVTWRFHHENHDERIAAHKRMMDDEKRRLTERWAATHPSLEEE